MFNDEIEKIKKFKSKTLKRDLLTISMKKKLFNSKIEKNINTLWIKNIDKNELEILLADLKENKDIFFDKNWNDIYYKKRSLGCTYCVKGKGCTIVLSYKCNRDCFFCYEETPLTPKTVLNPNDTKRIYDLIDSIMPDENNKTLAITGWEPLLFVKKIYEILEYINKNYPNKHKRIYTNWDLMTEEILINLNKLWLDEIRYSIKPWEEPNLKLYALTKKYIKTVMIEMPVDHLFPDYLLKTLEKIDTDWNIDWINLNELTFNNINVEKYKEKWYMLDTYTSQEELYQRYFDVSKIEIWVYWSKLLSLRLLKYFSEKKASFFLHYCDLDTVSHHHYLYKINFAKNLNIPYSEITKFGLHKILRVYWDFKNFDLSDIKYKLYNNYLETSVENNDYFDEKNFEKVIVFKDYSYKNTVDYKLT